MKQKETAIAIGVSERYYQHIENGTREGKGHIWDALEALFQTSQRQLRENDTESNSNTEETVEPSKAPLVLSGARDVKELEFASKNFTFDVESILDIAKDGRCGIGRVWSRGNLTAE
jgi:transcriptional regulator with XRE-family HTH domain